jgi:hypothetical protein
MSHDPPVPHQDSRSDQQGRPDEIVTVEWGEAERSRRSRAPRWLTGVGRDHRLVPVVAGLGVAAVIASLVGEWTMTTLPDAGPDGDPVRLPGGLADAAGFGAGYLIGLLGIVGSTALVFFGAPAVRHNARVLGLTLAGAVLVLLVAATAALHNTTERLLFGPDEGLRMEYGRGLTMAYAGTLTLGLALLLAGRFVAPPATGAATAAATADLASADPAAPDDPDGDRTAHRGDWPWSRPDTAREPTSDDRPAPSDLTVGPVAPFARPDQRDEH